MCTAATYKTKDFYFGRTLDYEFSYGDEITITPRNYELKFKDAFIIAFKNGEKINVNTAISEFKKNRNK